MWLLFLEWAIIVQITFAVVNCTRTGQIRFDYDSFQFYAIAVCQFVKI